MQRKLWIDNLRGLCMMAILLDHTEIYYTGCNIIDYNYYVGNTLMIFFFISGYLMYKESGFDIRHKIKAVLRTIMLPYFIYTTIIYIPKSLVHGSLVDWKTMAVDIITGQASWFVAALCVAEIIFSFAVYFIKNNDWQLFAVGCIGFAGSILLSNFGNGYFWQIDNAMQALLFIALGFLFHKHERSMETINKPFFIAGLFLALLFIKWIETINNEILVVWTIHITNYWLFVPDMIIGTLAMVLLFKRLKPSKILCWTGRHSLIYYFFCGGVPLIVSIALERLGMKYDDDYLSVIIAFVLVYAISSMIAWAVYRYIPFTMGIWKSKKAKCNL